MISSPARQLQVDGPAPMTGPAQVMDCPAGNGSATVDRSATVDGSATGYGPATVDGPAGDSPAGDGPASDGPAGDGPASDGPADGQATVDSSDSSALHFDDPAESEDPTRQPAVGMDGSAGHGTPPWNHASGWTRSLRFDRDKQFVFPSNTDLHQPGNTDRFYVYVDIITASDGPGYGSRYLGQPGCSVVNACSQT